MTNQLQQLLAASALICTCEKIAAAGILPEAEEAKLRDLISKACRAFEIPSIAERRPEIVALHSASGIVAGLPRC